MPFRGFDRRPADDRGRGFRRSVATPGAPSPQRVESATLAQPDAAFYRSLQHTIHSISFGREMTMKYVSRPLVRKTGSKPALPDARRQVANPPPNSHRKA